MKRWLMRVLILVRANCASGYVTTRDGFEYIFVFDQALFPLGWLFTLTIPSHSMYPFAVSSYLTLFLSLSYSLLLFIFEVIFSIFLSCFEWAEHTLKGRETRTLS